MRISDWSSDVCSSDLLHDADRFRMDQAKEGQRPADRRERRRLHQFPVNYHHHDRSQDDAGQRRAMAQYLEPLIEHAVVGENIHADLARSEEHTSELQSLMRISYAVFCLQTKQHDILITNYTFFHNFKL